jgi:hypothetical protein
MMMTLGCSILLDYLTRLSLKARIPEKERRHLTHETRMYMMVAPAYFVKFIVI